MDRYQKPFSLSLKLVLSRRKVQRARLQTPAHAHADPAPIRTHPERFTPHTYSLAYLFCTLAHSKFAWTWLWYTYLPPPQEEEGAPKGKRDAGPKHQLSHGTLSGIGCWRGSAGRGRGRRRARGPGRALRRRAGGPAGVSCSAAQALDGVPQRQSRAAMLGGEELRRKGGRGQRHHQLQLQLQSRPLSGNGNVRRQRQHGAQTPRTQGPCQVNKNKKNNTNCCP